MTKTTTQGVTNFHANCPYLTAPKIEDEFVGDDGELHYALSNGRTTLASRYNSLWHPKPGIVNHDKKYKGDNPDKRQQFLKP